MEEFLQQTLIDIGNYSLTMAQTLGTLLALGGIYAIYRLLYAFVRSSDLLNKDTSDASLRRIIRKLRIIFILVSILVAIYILGVDMDLYNTDAFVVRLSTLLFAIIVILLARFLDWIIGKVILHNIYTQRDREHIKSVSMPKKDEEKNAGRVVQWIVYVFAILLILNSFQLDYTLFSFEKDDYEFNFKISNIFTAVLIFMVARLVAWVLIQIILYGYYKQKSINIGSQFAINQLLKYIIYFIALVLALESLGIQMTLIWGGAAALLVGAGLGLQQTFNDFISGIILLFERSIEVGDVVEFDMDIGTVKKIGLRASLIETRAQRTIIVPNSKLVTDSVINWSHYHRMTRFQITVGVAYGSDTALVKKLLLKSVEDHPHVLDYPSPFVRFNDFSDSALTFDLYFFSREFLIIEDIRSEIRFEIDKLFREHKVKIPFPQREIWHNNPT
ncbi:MAG: mechanosensitive ion channel [Saprospiraceae bacterium]|nr:mechanosensitive ion channel [Saprospiraceae bacterium]